MQARPARAEAHVVMPLPEENELPELNFPDESEQKQRRQMLIALALLLLALILVCAGASAPGADLSIGERPRILVPS